LFILAYLSFIVCRLETVIKRKNWREKPEAIRGLD
jgi:hypothetical protein